MRKCDYRTRGFTLAALILGFVTGVSGQLAPMGPIAPTSVQDCQVFSQQVDQYWAKISQEHEACLASHKPDRPNEQAGSRTCSRSACQGLHDQLYGDFSLTGKSHQQVQREAVSACYNTVKENSKRQAQAQQEEAERNSKQAQEEAERKAKRMQEEAQRERQKSQPARVNEQKSKVSTGTASTRPLSPPQAHVGTPPPQQDPEKQKSEDALLALRAPFENADKERKAMGMTSPELANPFPGSTVSKKNDSEYPKLANPFPGQSDPKVGEGKNGDSEIGEYSAKGLEKGFDMLKDAVEQGKVQAKKELSSSAYKNYVKGADDAISISSGLTHFIQVFEYGDSFKNIYEADVPQARRQEEARLVYQAGKDTVSFAFSRDAMKEGIKNVVVRIFPDKVAPYIIDYGPAALAAANATFDSSEASAPGLLRYEKWDGMSSRQKEVVLSTWWKTYDMARKSGGPDFLAPEDLKVLIDQTDNLYKQSAP